MKNLAGDRDADQFITEELYLASIEPIPVLSDGEVTTTIAGRIGNWKLYRAWTYWVATTENITDGLPLKYALELHNIPCPTEPRHIMGTFIRSGGHAGAPSPDKYGANPDYDNPNFNNQLKALGYKEEYWKVLDKSAINITVGEVAQLCKEGKLNVERYVTTYHIDTQVGLNEFAKYLRACYE